MTQGIAQRRITDETAFVPAENDRACRERFARFSELIDGRPLRTTSAEAFVGDLPAPGGSAAASR